MSWLKRKILGVKGISISIIGVGNAGCRIGDLLIHELRESKFSVKSLAINLSDNFRPEIKNFSDKLWINEKYLSSHNNIDLATELMENKKIDLLDKIKNVVFYRKEDTKKDQILALHLVIASGGGTGSAGSMIVSKMISEVTGTAPTVIFVVPEKSEPASVQYNTAKAIHYMGFDAKGSQCPIILFDNEKLIPMFSDENIRTTLQKCNNYLVETLHTTILTATQTGDHKEFNASLKDFFKAFSEEAKGLGVIISLDKTFDDAKRAKNVRFSDILFNELDKNSSLTANVTRAKRGYLAVTAPLSYQTTFEARKIVKKFERGSIELSLTSIDEPVLSIRGVVTGIHPDFVDRFWDILEKGRDSKKSFLKMEHEIKQSYIQLKD